MYIHPLQCVTTVCFVNKEELMHIIRADGLQKDGSTLGDLTGTLCFCAEESPSANM